jgi:hypothetical protein
MKEALLEKRERKFQLKGEHFRVSQKPSWPQWKKDAYNEMFATSAHVKPI